MRHVAPLIQVVFTLYAFIIFTAFLLLIFPLVVLASFFGRIRGGNFIYFLCHLWTDFFYFLLGIRHKNIYETPHDSSKQYVFVFNHISFLDGPCIFKSIRKQHFRALGKAELARVPIFGFLYRKAVVMVQRDSAAHRARSVLELKSVLGNGISIVLSPEGTFNLSGDPLKGFYDGAFKIAIEMQTPIKPMLFLDTYERMHYRNLFTLRPGISRTVFLKEINVEGLTMDDVPDLKQLVYGLMQEGLIKYQASWIKNNTGKPN